jgi:hypothetical protein
VVFDEKFWNRDSPWFYGLGYEMLFVSWEEVGDGVEEIGRLLYYFIQPASLDDFCIRPEISLHLIDIFMDWEELECIGFVGGDNNSLSMLLERIAELS